MEITSNISRQDLVEFQLLHQLRSGQERLRGTTWALLSAVAIGAAVLWLVVPASARPVYSTAVLITLPVYLGLFYLLRKAKLARELNAALPADHPALGEYTVTMSEDGIGANHGETKSFYRWDQISRVSANGDYCYVYTGPQQAVILPQRCFPDVISFDTFVKLSVIYHWQGEHTFSRELAAAQAGSRWLLSPSGNTDLASHDAIS